MRKMTVLLPVCRRFLRDGRAKMEKELDLAGHKVTNLSLGALDNDAVNNKQLSDVLQKAQERLKK